MEQKQVPLTRPKNGIQGPSDIFTARYLPLTGQTQRCWPWTGQQAYCSQGTVLLSCTVPVSMLKNVKKREGVRSLFKMHPTRQAFQTAYHKNLLIRGFETTAQSALCTT